MKEEKLNAWSHAVGCVFAVWACWALMAKCDGCDWAYKVGVVVFAVGAFMQYLASTLYHLAEPGECKARLRIFDHVSIYMLIAASYTPVWLSVLGGVAGWVGFGVMWAVAIGGMVYKLLAIGKFPRLSLIIYLAMGWSVVFVARPVWDATPAEGLWWLLAEGLAYSGGAVFYANHKKYRYFHLVWHLFVLMGTVAHFMFLWNTL